MTVRRALWLLFALFIVYGGTIPFHFGRDVSAAFEKLRDLPLSPLISPETGRRLSIPDVVQNVLLFMPFGALGMLAAGAGARAGWKRLFFVTLAGAGLSMIVEVLQLFTFDRVASVADVVTNTTGAGLGAGAAWLARDTAAAALGRLHQEGLAGVPELRPFLIASVVLCIAAWQPFDVTLDVSAVGRKVRGLERDVWQFTGLRDEGTSLMLAFLLSSTLAGYLSALGERHAGRKAAALGIGLVFMLEASQIFIGSRMPGLWDAVVASCGIAVGSAVWSAAARLIWPGFWLGVLVAATFVAASLQMLSPFQIVSEYRGVRVFPFLGYYTRTTFETLSHVIELALLYFPLGFYLGAGPGRGWAVFATGLLATLAIALPIEYLQGWIVGRYGDITDIAVSLVGVAIGIRLARARP